MGSDSPTVFPCFHHLRPFLQNFQGFLHTDRKGLDIFRPSIHLKARPGPEQAQKLRQIPGLPSVFGLRDPNNAPVPSLVRVQLCAGGVGVGTGLQSFVWKLPL